MKVVFVDDTKQKGKRAGMGKLLALGSVTFDEEQIPAYAERVARIYEDVGVPDGCDSELKWSPPKGNWFKEDEGAACLTEVRERCLQAAKECDARAIVVIFDLNRTIVQGDRAEALVLKYLYERIEMMLSSPEERGIIVCDKPGGSHNDEDAWIGNTLALTNYGTEYVDPGAVILPILTAPSHHHPHLQLADLVAGATTAAVGGSDYGLELMPLVQDIMHTNDGGALAGTGLKLFPDELLNLHHWVLGAKSYTQGGRGCALPNSRLPYSKDDGMSLFDRLIGKLPSKRGARGRGSSTDD